MIKIIFSLFLVGYLVTSGVISFSSKNDVVSINLNYKNAFSEGKKQLENIKKIQEDTEKTPSSN